MLKRVALVGLALGLVAAGTTMLLVGWPAQDRWRWVAFLVFMPAATLIVTVGFTAFFRVRLTEDSVQHVLLGRWILSEFPLADFREVQRIPPVLTFSGGRRMRLVGMHRGRLAELERAIRARLDRRRPTRWSGP